jgi:uncharacterized protein (TIGR03067 family)
MEVRPFLGRGCVMWRTLIVGLIAAAGLAVAAPRAKDAPKKDSPIVGEWRLVAVDGGKSIPAIYTFSPAGELVGVCWAGSNFETRFHWRYTTNDKGDPFQIDMSDQDEQQEGIYQIDGDRLTLCYRSGRGHRPKKFGEKDAIEEVLERVKKKD